MMELGTERGICPRCGSSAEVRTVRELFDMLNGMQDTAMQRNQRMPMGGQRTQQMPMDGPGLGPSLGPDGQEWVGGRPAPGDPEWVGGRPAPTDPEWAGGRPAPARSYSSGNDSDPAQDIADAVMGITTRFIGRAIGKRMRRTFGDRVVPAMEARVQQMRQDSAQDQAAIVERYPDLRGCLHDLVIFLAGGSRTVPISEIQMPVTLAQADSLVARLRG
jgi:hypothetical protein